MKNMAFACKAKDLRKNLKFLWKANYILSGDDRKSYPPINRHRARSFVHFTSPIIEPKGY